MGLAEREPLTGLAWLGWIAAFAVQFYLLRQMQNWRHGYLGWLHAGTHWVGLIVLTWAGAYWAAR